MIRIYPEWNVKEENKIIDLTYETIRIYPEWNVKFSQSRRMAKT